MPGEFVSDGKVWRPALVQRHENGSIRVEDAQNKRIMNATTKIMPDPDDPTKHIQMTKSQELGNLLTMPDPKDTSRILPFVHPDPAALETIRKQLGEGFEEASEFPITAYPENKQPNVVLNAAGDPATAEKLAAQDKQIADLKAMVESLAKGKGN
jgi:hypothetical protein